MAHHVHDFGDLHGPTIAARVGARSVCHRSSGSMGLSGGIFLPVDLSGFYLLRGSGRIPLVMRSYLTSHWLTQSQSWASLLRLMTLFL